MDFEGYSEQLDGISANSYTLSVCRRTSWIDRASREETSEETDIFTWVKERKKEKKAQGRKKKPRARNFHSEQLEKAAATLTGGREARVSLV